MINLKDAKAYLRVDSGDEDEVIKTTLKQARGLVADVARMEPEDVEDTTVGKQAVYYTLGYLYEHRNEADLHGLTLDIRSFLCGVREAAF